MKTKAEAAYHCGRTIKQFERECPVAPLVFPNGDRRWDERDLDAWLDSVKRRIPLKCDDDIIASIGVDTTLR